jgi:hypothetical protein
MTLILSKLYGMTQYVGIIAQASLIKLEYAAIVAKS